MWSLLDADQEIPWVDQPLVLHHKWRLYVQPFNASYHTPVTYGFDASLLVGSPYEYDVPNCSASRPGGGGVVVPGCALGGPDNKTWIHTITGAKRGENTFAQLNFHCHAPTCLSMAVYACDAATALTDCNASVGKLICEQRPVYVRPVPSRRSTSARCCSVRTLDDDGRAHNMHACSRHACVRCSCSAATRFSACRFVRTCARSVPGVLLLSLPAPCGAAACTKEAAAACTAAAAAEQQQQQQQQHRSVRHPRVCVLFVGQ
jgi:hypothetical protein